MPRALALSPSSFLTVLPCALGRRPGESAVTEAMWRECFQEGLVTAASEAERLSEKGHTHGLWICPRGEVVNSLAPLAKWVVLGSTDYGETVSKTSLV